ncbi:MAG: DUF4255 domain-containing protein [Blastocatellia bacterium]
MYTALQATSQTLAKFLEARFKADPLLKTFFGVGSMIVSLNTPEEMAEKPAEGLSVWLYRVVRDDQRLNDRPERISPSKFRQAPLPLRLHYLMTPVTNKKTGDPETEQVILGKVLQLFHSHSVLRGSDLQGDFVGTEAELTLRLEPMNLEEITRVWEALVGSYQLSVSYEVSVVNISAEQEPDVLTPVDVVMPEYGVIVASESI